MNRNGSCDHPQQHRPFWVATRTYTARCPEGKVGDPVTITRQYRSYISLHDAETRALCLAKREAETEIVCSFEATQCWQPPCGGLFYPPECRTAQSQISPEDAQQKALILAKGAAEAHCS
jgi:hypothetical protein